MSALVRFALPLVSGTLFGAGLTLGGMTDRRRVQGFLDVAGRWDPTLLFVIAGAVAVMALAWRLGKRMERPLFAESFSLPERGDVDGRLIAGAALFGIGWGLAGLCPGPAIASLALAPAQAALFIAAMLAGMAAHRWIVESTLRKGMARCS